MLECANQLNNLITQKVADFIFNIYHKSKIQCEV